MPNSSVHQWVGALCFVFTFFSQGGRGMISTFHGFTWSWFALSILLSSLHLLVLIFYFFLKVHHRGYSPSSLHFTFLFSFEILLFIWSFCFDFYFMFRIFACDSFIWIMMIRICLPGRGRYKPIGAGIAQKKTTFVLKRSQVRAWMIWSGSAKKNRSPNQYLPIGAW
jgi:hypothetical protein